MWLCSSRHSRNTVNWPFKNVLVHFKRTGAHTSLYVWIYGSPSPHLQTLLETHTVGLGVCTLLCVWALSVMQGGRHDVCTASHPHPLDSSAFRPATLTEKVYSLKSVKGSDPRAPACSLFHEHQWRKLVAGGESKGLNVVSFFLFLWRVT